MNGMLRQNRELRPDRIWNFSIPAWWVDLPGRGRFMTCPNAGPCAQVCYARNGTYRFRNVLEAHTRNLTRYLDDPQGWTEDLILELQAKRFRPNGIPRDLPIEDDEFLLSWAAQGGAAVRIHDSGDFFSLEYLRAWMKIAQATPDVLFYAYTKEVSMFQEAEKEGFPRNFRYLFSTGGLQDHLIGSEDRHADVFPTQEAIEAAGYSSQEASDLLAVCLPSTRIGIPANNIRHYNIRLRGRRFSDLTAARSERLRGS